ncbi:MAG: DinB family protein [Bryobacteraceae bacterium]
MTKDDVHLLYEYDRWANNRVLQAAAALSTEQFTRDLGGAFRSVRDTLVHIVCGEWMWLAYWSAPPLSSTSVTDLRARRDALFNPDGFPTVAEVQLKWAEVEKKQVEFVNRVTNESLEAMLPFRTTQVRLAHLMQHLANHSTYHRGQVALMMRQLGSAPLATDFHEFLAEGPSSTARVADRACL